MPSYTLCVLNTNYSSWSIRVLLAARYVKLPMDIEKFYMDEPDFKRRLQNYSPSSKAPSMKVTEDSGHSYLVWDSLAILEYLAELYPELLPKDREERAFARSISAEMHSGFPKLRELLTHNIRARKRLLPTILVNEELQRELRRIESILGDCRKRTLEKGGDQDEGFLFGKFTIADAMFIPVCYRYRTYSLVAENEHAKNYMETIYNWSLSKELEKEANEEDHIVPAYEHLPQCL